jgi:hypothetical protein
MSLGNHRERTTVTISVLAEQLQGYMVERGVSYLIEESKFANVAFIIRALPRERFSEGIMLMRKKNGRYALEARASTWPAVQAYLDRGYVGTQVTDVRNHPDEGTIWVYYPKED